MTKETQDLGSVCLCNRCIRFREGPRGRWGVLRVQGAVKVACKVEKSITFAYISHIFCKSFHHGSLFSRYPSVVSDIASALSMKVNNFSFESTKSVSQ